MWFAEHLLQHPDSILICLDTWEGGSDFEDKMTSALSATMSAVEVRRRGLFGESDSWLQERGCS